MKKITEYQGNRTKTGWHTGHAIYKDEKGRLWLSTEQGLKRLGGRKRKL